MIALNAMKQFQTVKFAICQLFVLAVNSVII